MRTPHISAILCADWGKEADKRAVYMADVPARIVRRLEGRAWSVGGVLTEAERLASSGRGPVLATFDAPLGVPESYLVAAARVPSWRSPETFLEFLAHAHASPNFFNGTSVAADWRVERPFFSVPAGAGEGDGFHRHQISVYRVRRRWEILCFCAMVITCHPKKI